MAALEESAVRQGYTRAYLSTGFRQPEAFALYVSLGYRPLFDTEDQKEGMAAFREKRQPDFRNR